MVVTLAAGYVGPGLFGVGAAVLLGAGHAVAMLWLALLLHALLLLQIRNWFGLFLVCSPAAGCSPRRGGCPSEASQRWPTS